MRDPTEYKTISLRMTVDLSRAVEMLAAAEGKSQVEVLRDAVDAHIKAKRADPAFQERLRRYIEADLALLRSLQAPQ